MSKKYLSIALAMVLMLGSLGSTAYANGMYPSYDFQKLGSNEVYKLQEEIIRLEDEINRLSAKKYQDELLVKELVEKLSKAMTESEKLKHKENLSKLEQELQEKITEIESVRAELVSMTKSYEEKKNETDAAKKTLEELTAGLQAKTEELNQAKAQLEEEKSKSDADLELLKTLEEKVLKLEQEIEKISAEIKVKEEQMPILEEELLNLETQLKSLQEKMKPLENRKVELEREIETLKSLITSSKEEIQRQVDEIVRKIRFADSEIYRLKEELFNKYKQLDEKLKGADEKKKIVILVDDVFEDSKQITGRTESRFYIDVFQGRNRIGNTQADGRGYFSVEIKESTLKDGDRLYVVAEDPNDSKINVEESVYIKKSKQNEQKTDNSKTVENTKKNMDITLGSEERKVEFAVFPIGKKYYNLIKGSEKTTVYMDVDSYITEGRTMLPLRYVANALGLNVEFDNKTREAIFSNTSNKMLIKKSLRLNIDTGVMKMSDGQIYVSDVKPIIKNGRMFAPISSIAKSFGASAGDITDGVNQMIEWDAKNNSVYIFKEIK